MTNVEIDSYLAEHVMGWIKSEGRWSDNGRLVMWTIQWNPTHNRDQLALVLRELTLQQLRAIGEQYLLGTDTVSAFISGLTEPPDKICRVLVEISQSTENQNGKEAQTQTQTTNQ